MERFIIDNRNQNRPRPGNRNVPHPNKSFDDKLYGESIRADATQRIKISDTSSRSQGRSSGRSASPQKSVMSRKERATVITLFSVAGVLLIGIVIALITMFGGTEDNGLILDNVYVAGVNIGGLTESDAKKALLDVAEDYSQLNMTVKVLDTTVVLAPDKTGAELDIEAVVKAAYDLGRTGSRSEQEKAQNASSHNLSVIPYLNLSTDYIESIVEKLGERYSTLRSDPTITVKGEAPPAVIENYDTTRIWETMEIYMGTAEYDLSTEQLYQQILDAYDSNIYEVVAKCSVNPPNVSVLDLLEEEFRLHCRIPVNATCDEKGKITSDHVYGYGFDLESVKEQVKNAQYGQTLTIPMTLIRPGITTEDLTENMFRDVLGSYVLPVENNNNLISNLKMVCNEFNKVWLMPGDTFSFNELIGETTRQRGYKSYSQFVGKIYTQTVYGGGVDQAASALYYAVLQADMDVLERHSHSYAPTFIAPGLDADIQYGSKDLKFRNNTESPVRIVATYENGSLSIQLLGMDTKNYTVEIVCKTDKVYEPVTLMQTMPENNVGGYKAGDILQTPIIGYDVTVTKVCTYKPEEEVPGEPGEPGTEDPIEPSEPTEPSEPELPTEPSEPELPSEPGEPGLPGTEEPGTEEPAPNFFEVPVGQSHYDKRNEVKIEIYIPTVTPPAPIVP